MDISLEQLLKIMPNAGPHKSALYLPFLNSAMNRGSINTPTRQAMFIAQIAHETGELRYMEEIWGPTPAQANYWHRADLGNSEPSDGENFKGRGSLQITGKDNYDKYGKLMGVDLLSNPALAAQPAYAFRIGVLYWNEHGLSTWADQNTEEAFQHVTKRINGGLNGEAQRLAFWHKATAVLATP